MTAEEIIKIVITAIVTAIVTGSITYIVTIKRKVKAVANGILSCLRADLIGYHDKYTDKGFCPIYGKDAVEKAYKAYHDLDFPTDKLVSLASKTTCKDRWRQVINEADRLRDKNKYLLTLQQGISTAQLKEMAAEKVVLIVPKPYITTYPKEEQDKIWTIKKFVSYIQELQRT